MAADSQALPWTVPFVRNSIKNRITWVETQNHSGRVTAAVGVVSFGSANLPGIVRNLGVTPQMAAFLDTLAMAEGTSLRGHCNAEETAGYQAIQGCSGDNSNYILRDFRKHPERLGPSSNAAGRYQFISQTWNTVVLALPLYAWIMKAWADTVVNFVVPQFGPVSQDMGAFLLIRVTRQGSKWKGRSPHQIIDSLDLTARPEIDVDEAPAEFKGLLGALSNEWASLPVLSTEKSAYGQPVQRANHLWKVYRTAFKVYTNNQQASVPTDDDTTISADFERNNPMPEVMALR